MHADKKTCGCACSHTHPVDDLSAEHQTILGVIHAIERQVRELRGGSPIRQTFWGDVLEFIENYADRCHHGKEETLLFAELERAGMSAQHGPTACMRSEHEMGRQHRTAMTNALTRRDATALADAATNWCDLLRHHIAKEDHVLFPMARDLLDHAAVARLRKGFANVEHHLMGEGTHCRYEELGRRLAGGDAVAR